MNNDLISREALKKAIENYLAKRQDVIIWETDMFNMLDNAPTVEPQMLREYRQALEALEYIKEHYILVEKSPRDDPDALLVAGQQNGTN